jgi:hypothetical protein
MMNTKDTAKFFALDDDLNRVGEAKEMEASEFWKTIYTTVTIDLGGESVTGIFVAYDGSYVELVG